MINTSKIVVEPPIDGISRIKLNEPGNYNALSSKTIKSLINIFLAACALVSSTTVSWPERAAQMAAINPAAPAPMTTVLPCSDMPHL